MIFNSQIKTIKIDVITELRKLIFHMGITGYTRNHGLLPDPTLEMLTQDLTTIRNITNCMSFSGIITGYVL